MKILKPGEDFSFDRSFGFTSSADGTGGKPKSTKPPVRFDRDPDDAEADDADKREFEQDESTLIGRRHGGRVKRDVGGPVAMPNPSVPPAMAPRPGATAAMTPPLGQNALGGSGRNNPGMSPVQEPTISMPMSTAAQFAKKMIGVGQQMGVHQTVQGLAKATGQFPTGTPGQAPAGAPQALKHGGRVHRAVGGPIADPSAAGGMPPMGGQGMPPMGGQGMPPMGGGAEALGQPRQGSQQNPPGQEYWRGRSPVGMYAPGQDTGEWRRPQQNQESMSGAPQNGMTQTPMKHGGHALGGKLTAEERHSLPKTAFALPGERYPIHNESHARNALARVAQHGTSAEQKAVRAAVHRRFPDIGEK